MGGTAGTLGLIAALWLAALISPGPDFLLVTRISVTRGRAQAMRTVFGVAAGLGVWAVAGFFGIHALFVAAPWLYLALKVAGGAYLIVLGVRLIAGSWASSPIEHRPERADRPGGRAFQLGFVTNLANPKAPIFVSSLFAATLPQHPPIGLGLGAVAVIFLLSLGWYALVARLLTLRRVADAFARLRHWIDRAAGLAFMAFGSRLVLDRT